MKKIFDKIMGAMGMVEYEDDDYSHDNKRVEEKSDPIGFGFNTNSVNDESNLKAYAQNNNSKIVNIHNNVNMKMVVVCPQSYEEAKEVCDYVRARKPVVVNLESMDHAIGQRVMDFLSGSCYSLNGDIKRVTKNIFILAPDNVDIASETSGQFSTEKPNTLPWMKVTN
ncbi:MAG TPA: hypothetical protein DEP72_06025 [Clostridiales bacterium]|nr:MAG: hypothetical protein A2Y18_01440 [Clostridiales bacterium GWD2_32_19]HCC07696.1 hypothetical protein [Clostridiales bacterium]